MDIILKKDVGSSKAGEVVKTESAIYSLPGIKKEAKSVIFKNEILYPADFDEVVK
jgi:hypothetical protein